MKNSLRITSIFALAMSLLSTSPMLLGQGVKPATAKPSSAKAVLLPAGGRLLGELYTNSEYKLELRIPNGFVLTPSTEEDDKEGAKLLAGGNQERQKALEAASKGNVSLIDLTLQKPGVFRNVSLLAEDISSAPLVESGKDYINHIAAQLQASKMKMKAVDVDDENLEGRIFSTKALEMQVKGTKVHQAYSATVIGRRALVIILTSESPSGLRELMAQFKPRFLEPLPQPALQKAQLRQGGTQTDTGSISNGMYTNPFFKINFRVPEGWTLRDDARAAVRQKGLDNVSNPKVQQAVQTGKMGMEVLFIATPPESTNSVMMMSIALGLDGARVPPAVLLNSITAAVHKRGFQPVSKPEDKKISGQRFIRAVVKGSAAGLDVFQAYNAAVMRDHLVCLVVTARDMEELDNLLKVSSKNLEFD